VSALLNRITQFGERDAALVVETVGRVVASRIDRMRGRRPTGQHTPLHSTEPKAYVDCDCDSNRDADGRASVDDSAVQCLDQAEC
jgi:hypothetical protein